MILIGHYSCLVSCVCARWEGTTKEAHNQEEEGPSWEPRGIKGVGGKGGGGESATHLTHTHTQKHTLCVSYLGQRLQSRGRLDAGGVACATCCPSRLGNRGPRAPGRRHCCCINCQAAGTTLPGHERQWDLISRSDGGPGDTEEP